MLFFLKIQSVHFEIWKEETERKEDLGNSTLFKIADNYHK